MNRVYSFLTLFTSVSTLLCCALPALIVTLGFGAAMAGFLSDNPELIWLSENKIWLFLIGGLLLISGGIIQYLMRNKPCPIDEVKEACSDTRQSSKKLYFLSVAIYLVGLAFAYIIPLLNY